ncbi:MAG: hypothetical protein Ta2B_17980 [Termitinemataceae bacterium]|nr:MAG: hypothetical protein Ta2B_17980 [Termitinemataceae bacterium]
MSNTDRIFEKALVCMTYSFLAMPFIIFSIGFMKPLFGIPVAVCVLISLLIAIKHTELSWVPQLTKNTVIKLIICVTIIALWVFVSGIGKFVWQNSDHPFRNEIFKLLVTKPWPVSSILEGQEYKFVYYMGFWMPAAVIGKLFGLTAGFVFQYLWAILGVFCTFLLVCSLKHKFLLRTLIVIILFSGLDYVGTALVRHAIPKLISASHDEWWAGAFQYSSMTTQIFWVFNQAIPAWVATALLLNQKNNKNIIFIMGVLLLNSTFPFMGLLPIICHLILSKSKINDKINIGNSVKSCMSIQNVAGGGIAGIITFLFLASNVRTSTFSFVSTTLVKYFTFCILEFGLYMFFVFKSQYKNPLFYVIGISLLIFPAFYIPDGNFIMRASIPPLFILMLMVSEKIETYKNSKCYFALMFVFLIGGITPMHEMLRTAKNTYDGQENWFKTEEEIMTDKNFMGDSQSFFFTHISK